MIVLCNVSDFLIFLRIKMIFCLSDRRFLRVPSIGLNRWYQFVLLRNKVRAWKTILFALEMFLTEF